MGPKYLTQTVKTIWNRSGGKKKNTLKVIQNLSVDVENSAFLMWRWKIIFIIDSLCKNAILGGC